MTNEMFEQKRTLCAYKAWKKWKEGKATLDRNDCYRLSEVFGIRFPFIMNEFISTQRIVDASDDKLFTVLTATTYENRRHIRTIDVFLEKLLVAKENEELENKLKENE